jgi:ferric-dicitrate binding protein FerR (iron transport regulator)
MQTESNRIEILFKHYLDNSISREEYTEFWQLLKDTDTQSLSPQLQTLWLQTEGLAPLHTDEEWNRKLKALIEKAEKEDAAWTTFQRRKTRRIPTWTKWVAAACILALVGVLANVYLKKNNKEQPPVATTHDVAAPTETRAVITLANGSKVYLDSVDNGTIASESNVNVVKTEDGKIAYKPVTLSGVEASTVAYNTLTNPRGSKVIDMTLSDGSHVWLNSNSSIKYPVAFIGKERIVEITGEAYFEVKHNAKQPFKVHLPNGSVVEDIGTSFNINAYSDEADFRTTLIEGTIAVSLSGVEGKANRKILKPGEQAIVNSSTPLRVTKDVDIDDVLAWKNGRFEFGGNDL